MVNSKVRLVNVYDEVLLLTTTSEEGSICKLWKGSCFSCMSCQVTQRKGGVGESDKYLLQDNLMVLVESYASCCCCCCCAYRSWFNREGNALPWKFYHRPKKLVVSLEECLQSVRNG